MIEHHWSQGGGVTGEPQALSDPSWYVYNWISALPHIDAWVLTEEQARLIPTTATEIKRQLEATNPLAGQESVYAQLLAWAIQAVDCTAVASALYGEQGEVDL